MVKKTEKNDVKIAIIGGSGLYEIDGVKNLKEHKIKTPFGMPSDSVMVGEIEGIKCAFLPRHGRGHKISPSEINNRANIYALKSLGVEKILSISACGSLKEEVKPKDFLIPDQLFDRTKGRTCTFYGDGIVGHVGFAEPFCEELRQQIRESLSELNIEHHNGGTYICIEGPMFSPKAESKAYRKQGFSVIGMTAVPEAKLAREAEICYATVALVTDYDVWKEGEEVTLETVLANMHANVTNAKKLITKIVPILAKQDRKCACMEASKYAIMTAKDKMNKKTYEKIKLIIGKYY